MTAPIIGREAEIKILERLLHSGEPELLAIYGRRRVGKTFLIKTYYKEHLAFSCSGQYNGKTREQLTNFIEQLNIYFPKNKELLHADTWQFAFSRLRSCLENSRGTKKKVVFFDELPWLDSHKSGFLSSFSYFWNEFASQQKDLLVIICGSAASWIIDKVVNNKGGLHNRITQRIRLLPFTLQETESYLQNRQVRLDRYQILQLYMAMGGVPAYLNAVERGKSVAQNIESICFSKDGALVGEFDNLYSALFNTPEKHIQVIQALARKNTGLTRSGILKTAKLLTGGSLSNVLNELVESGFIQRTLPYGKKEKDSLYRLSDPFSLFYYKFMHTQKGNELGQWINRQTTTAYLSWCGYAFENICFNHLEQVKKALQIGAVQSTASSWRRPGTSSEPGAQIDLLLDRADQCINICEIKFSTGPFAIDKKYARELEQKLAAFRENTGSRKTLFLTFITTYGLSDTIYKEQLADADIRMDALFG
jgi:AAA+ ATPase superfamily predicted ATPase